MAGSKGALKPGRRPLVYKGVELRCSWRFEEEARTAGHVVVAGVDEVGRGALCGPVVAARGGPRARASTPTGSTTPSASPRGSARRWPQRIRGQARGLGASACAEPEEIDRLNILRATYLAMRRAVEGLGRAARPACSWTPCTVPGLALPAAGRSSRATPSRVSIAAASIVAKVARDAIMRECDLRLPRLRPGAEHGLRERRPSRRPAPAGALRHPPALVRGDPAVALLRTAERDQG